MPTPVVSRVVVLLDWYLVLVRIGVKIPQNGNRANRYGRMATVHGHVWRTLCSVCATGARVAQPRALQLVICRS